MSTAKSISRMVSRQDICVSNGIVCCGQVHRRTPTGRPRFGLASVLQGGRDRTNGAADAAQRGAHRGPADHAKPERAQSVVATLTARIETLEAEFAKVEAAAAVHRADFERDRERRLMSEVLKATAETMAAREAAARLAGELAAIQAGPWWRRLAG
jgi:hypothetical protein